MIVISNVSVPNTFVALFEVDALKSDLGLKRYLNRYSLHYDLEQSHILFRCHNDLSKQEVIGFVVGNTITPLSDRFHSEENLACNVNSWN